MAVYINLINYLNTICCSGFTWWMILKDWSELYFLDFNFFLFTSYFLLLNMQNVFRFFPQWFYMCILPSLSVLLSQSMNYALIPVSHTAITLGCSCVIDWHVLHSPWLLLCSLSSQSQFKFVCEAILKVYEEGLVKPLKPRCMNPTNAMPAFPENDAEIHWRDLLHMMMFSSVTEWWRIISSQEHRT